MEKELFIKELAEVLDRIQGMLKEFEFEEIMSIAVSADGYVTATISDDGKTYSLSRCTYKDSYTYSVGKELERNDNTGMH